jgi:hypothetical protein
MRLELRQCAWCGKQFAPIRVDQRFDCRTCLDRYFSREKQLAILAYRARHQRSFSFFDDDINEATRNRRTG